MRAISYHIYNRGVRKHKLFHRKGDYTYFMRKVGEILTDLNLSVTTFDLIPNHFHFSTIPRSNKSIITKFMHRLGTSYGMYYNKIYKSSGHVFQGKYNAKPVIDDPYQIHLSRYIHQNCAELCPKKNWVDMVNYMRTYKYSSYRYYIKHRAPKWLDTSYLLEYFDNDTNSFCAFTEQPIRKWEFSMISAD